MAWSCPDCRTYTVHTNYVCPRCHLGALYDVRNEDELQRDGYHPVPESDAAPQTPFAPARRTFLQDVMALSCAGWLLQSGGRFLRRALLCGSIFLLLTNAEKVLPWLLDRSAPLLSLLLVFWLFWTFFRRIFTP